MIHRTVRIDGTQMWFRDCFLGRGGDQPAVVSVSGTQEWWQNGKRHRQADKPAVVCADGTHEWWVHGQRHREGDLPAVVWADGTHEWWTAGGLHREGNKPAVVGADGWQQWWTHGRLQRGTRVANFWQNGPRFAWVQAVVQVGLAPPCDVPRDADRAVACALLAAAQVSHDTPPTHRVTHEYAFLVALFL